MNVLALPVVIAAALLALSAAPALAAPPPTPETTTATPTATTAVLNGVLNPTAPGSPGSFQFSYAQSATACTPGTLDPESPELAMGTEKEAKSVTVTGLEPNKEYSFCIIAYGLFGGVTEPAEGAAVAFKTLTAKPAVDAESTSAVSSTGATLEAQLNPNNQSTTYLFEYSTKEKTGALEGTIVKVPAAPPAALEGFGDQSASAPTNTLLAGTTYFYRVVAKNATGTTDGTVSATGFTTPPAPKTEAVTAITATTATFHGKLKPLNEKVATEYQFDYNTGEEPACNGESQTTAVSAGTGKGTEATATTAVTGLQPNQKYTVCLVSINESGSQVATTPVHFTTPAAAPTIEASSEKASNVTPYEATLEGQVNPDNQPTTYAFEYSTTEAGGKLTGTITKLEGESPLEGAGEQTASIPTGHVLAPGTTYHFRLIAKNTSGPVEGAGEFATPALTAPVIEGESSSGVTAELATLEGTVNPDAQETTCSFEYGTEAALTSGVTSVPCPAALGTGFGGAGTSVALTSLIPSSTYYYRVTATNATGTTTDPTIEHFETGAASAPVVADEAASQVEQTAAVLEGEISPEHVASSYQFEYLTEAQYNENGKSFTGADTSPGAKPIAAEEPATKVTAHITGLTFGTTYEYRLTATSKCQAGEPCTTNGPTKTLTTPTPGSNTPAGCPNEARRDEQAFGKDLPDCRAYELVSPTNTNGQDAIEPDGLVPRAALSGNAIAYTSLGNYGAARGAAEYGEYISRRGPEGWLTENVSPLQFPKSQAGFSPDNTDAFTPELTAGIFRVGIVEEEQYGLFREVFGSDSGQHVGEASVPLGESTNLENVVYGAGSATEWLDGRAVPVTVNNNEEVLSGAVGSQGIDVDPVSEAFDTWHAVSADGSRVIFTSPARFYEQPIEGPKLTLGSLYQRINVGAQVAPEPEREQSKVNAKEECIEPEKACTIDVSASQRTEPDPQGPKPVRYWTASTNGSRIFFTSKQELTNDAYTGPADDAANLYEYEAGEPGEQGRLTDLSVDDVGEGAAVEGVVQSSEDGSYVYFVAEGVLAPGATAGRPNLYLSENGQKEPHFVATLGANDETDWSGGSKPSKPVASAAPNELQTTDGGPATNTATVSPGGSLLAFLSEARLTSYDSEAAAPGECKEDLGIWGSETGHCREVYLYDASTHAIVCASCNPSGARPVGPANLSPGNRGSEGSGDPAAQSRPRNITANGAVFFDSSDALAGAAGGVENVFEFDDGRIYPISDVTGGQPSRLLDASASGEDVFFASPNRLLPQAQGEVQAVYDARVDGGFPLPANPEPCRSSETCAPGAIAPPVAGAAASEAYAGPGNPAASAPPKVAKPKAETRAQKLTKALRVCRKDKKKKKRDACEKQARKKYGAKASARKSAATVSNERRAK